MEHYYKTVNGYFDYECVIREAVEQAKDGDHFVEVGAFMGKSAAFAGVEILNSGKKIKYDIVDHFLGSENDPVGNNCKEYCLENIKPVESVVTLVNLPSVEAAKLYPDNSLRYVFLDGDHNYPGISSDLVAWYRKLAPGGIFAGHDHEPPFPGVIRAVKEFFGDLGLKYELLGHPYVWRMVKP